MSLILCQDDIIGPWVYNRSQGQWVPGMGRTIGWWNGERITAGYVFTQFNGYNIFADYAVDGGYLPKGLLFAVGAYVFTQLGCRRLTLVVEEGNIPSARICYKLGAALEATLQGASRTGGDLLIFRLTPDCLLWRKLNGQGQQLSLVP